MVHALAGGAQREDTAFGVLILSIGLSFWVQYARTVRGSTLVEKGKDYVQAARLLGLSGPAIKPLALRMVWEVSRALPGFPVVGIGGIADVDDALDFLVAGASAVQVGTATFYDPQASERLIDELAAQLDDAGISGVREIVGTLRSNRG